METRTFLVGWGLFFFLTGGAQGFVSPFPSTVEGLSTPNAHVIATYPDGSPRLLRSMAPRNRKEMREIKKFGVTDILIFKNGAKKLKKRRKSDPGDEVEKEIQDFESLGYREGEGNRRITSIPFRYKGMSFKTACEQTIQALKLIKQKVIERNGVMLIHCTVGEDRTGYLSGLWALMNAKTIDIGTLTSVFHDKMCLLGYAAGNACKAQTAFEKVVRPLQQEMTPTFLQMAMMIRDGTLNWHNLNPVVCGHYGNYNDILLRLKKKLKVEDFVCESSPLMPQKYKDHPKLCAERGLKKFRDYVARLSQFFVKDKDVYGINTFIVAVN